MNIWKKLKIYSCDSGFTIVEIIMVVVIISVIAAMGFPYFNKTFETTREKEAIEQLKKIWHAQQMFYAKYRRYWPSEDEADPVYGENDWVPLSFINDGLNIKIIPDEVRYRCIVYSNTPPQQEFHCGAILFSDENDNNIRLTEADLSTVAGLENPCCEGSGDECHVLKDCP